MFIEFAIRCRDKWTHHSHCAATVFSQFSRKRGACSKHANLAKGSLSGILEEAPGKRGQVRR
jgi:hypothetical protein